MAHSNGKVYINTNVTPNIGISTDDVAYVLGRSTGDIGQLCGDVNESGEAVNRINIWAAHKPIRSQKLRLTTNETDPDQDDYAISNYGFDLDETSGASSDNIVELFNRAKTLSGNWIYLHPRGVRTGYNTEWYRLLDFDGYNHNAIAPYFIGAPTRLSVFGSKIIDIHEEHTAEIKIDKLSKSLFDQTSSMDNVFVYLLFKKTTATVPTIITPINGVTPITALNTGSVNLSANFPSNGTYEMIAVASAWDAESGEETYDYNWVYLPGTWQSVIINDQDYILDVNYAEEDVAIDFGASISNTGQLSFRADVREINKNIGSPAENVTFNLEITYWDNTQQTYESILDETINGYDIDAGDEQDNYLHITRTVNASEAYDKYGDDALSNIYVRLYYQYDAENEPTYIYYRYFDFLDSIGSSHSYSALVNVPRVSLQSIINLQ